MNWFENEADARRYVDELEGVVVPVNITIEGTQRILCLDQVDELLRKAKKIAIVDCECRAVVKSCNAPLDVCLYLDSGADEQIERGLGKEVSLETALDALRRSNEAGLVYVALTDRGEAGPMYICSCCSCCCHSIIAMRKFGFDDAIIASDMISHQQSDLCDDCGLCVERCHFEARKLVEGHLIYEMERCFGCGVCLSACPNDAITLEKRHN